MGDKQSPITILVKFINTSFAFASVVCYDSDVRSSVCYFSFWCFTNIFNFNLNLNLNFI